MKLHGNARSCPASRRLMCERIDGGWTVDDAADAACVSVRSAYRWLARWRAGDRELSDRSSAPHRVANRTPKRVEATIERLRRLRMTSTAIAAKLQMAVSTVGAVLRRLGLHRLSRLEPLEPPNRYCRRHPGELIHVDVKKLGRFSRPGHRVTGTRTGCRNYRAGWEFVHVAVDDCTRLAYVEVLPDERGPTTVGFFERAFAWFARHGVQVERSHERQRTELPITSRSPSSAPNARSATCSLARIGRARTAKPNGSSKRCCASGPTPPPTRARAPPLRALPGWIDYYNHQRPHSALGHRTPASRLTAA